MFNTNNISEHETINDRRYKNFIKLNKTLENIVKNVKKYMSNFVIEISDKIFYYNMYFSINYALLLLIILIGLVCIAMVVLKKI